MSGLSPCESDKDRSTDYWYRAEKSCPKNLDSPEKLEGWERRICRFVEFCNLLVNPECDTNYEQSKYYANWEVNLEFFLKENSRLDTLFLHDYNDQTMPAGSRVNPFNESVSSTRESVDRFFREFEDDDSSFGKPPDGSDKNSRADWLKKRLVAFNLARLGWNVFEGNHTETLSKLMKYIPKSRMDIEYKTNVLNAVSQEPSFRSYHSMWKKTPSVSCTKGSNPNDNGYARMKLVDEASTIFPLYEKGTIGFELAKKYTLCLVKILTMSERASSDNPCAGAMNDQAVAAKDILRRIYLITNQFLIHPAVVLKSLIMQESLRVTNRLSQTVQLERIKANKQKIIEAYAMFLLAENAAPGRMASNKDILCIERGTVFEGLNSHFVEKMLASDPVLCIEIVAVRKLEGADALPSLGGAPSYDTERNLFKEVFERNDVVPHAYDAEISVYGEDYYTVQILIRKDVKNAFKKLFGDSGNALFPDAAALSAHRYLSYAAFEPNSGRGPRQFEKQLAGFSLRAASAKIVSNTFLQSTISMPNRVSVKQLVECATEDHTIIVKDDLGLDTVRVDIKRVFSGFLRLLPADATQANNAFNSDMRKSFNTWAVPLKETQQAIDRLNAYRLKRDDEPIAKQRAMRTFKSKKQEETYKLKKQLWNEMAGRQPAVAKGPPFPENKVLSKMLFALSEFAYAFEFVSNLTKLFQEYTKRLLKRDTDQAASKQTFANFGGDIGKFLAMLETIATEELYRLRLRVGRVYASLQSHRDWAQAGFYSVEDWKKALLECTNSFKTYTNYTCGPMVAILHMCALCVPSEEDEDVSELKRHIQNVKYAFKLLLSTKRELEEGLMQIGTTSRTLRGYVETILRSDDSNRWLNEALACTKLTTHIYSNALLLELLDSERYKESRCMGVFENRDGTPLPPSSASDLYASFPLVHPDEPRDESEAQKSVLYNESYFAENAFAQSIACV